MSWHCSQALVAEFSEVDSSDGEPSALSKSTSIAERFLRSVKMTGSLNRSKSGTTSELLTENHGEESSISSPEDSRARTFLARGEGLGLTESVPVYGPKWRGSSVRFDQDSRLWRIHPCLPLGDLGEFSGTWPRWGMMRNGECWELTTLAPRISAKEFGYVPTPRASDCNGGGVVGSKNKMNLRDYVMEFPTPCASNGAGGSNARKAWKKLGISNPGRLNPHWAEWLMGWPIGWTDLKPLATDRFHEWLNSHGEF